VWAATGTATEHDGQKNITVSTRISEKAFKTYPKTRIALMTIHAQARWIIPK